MTEQFSSKPDIELTTPVEQPGAVVQEAADYSEADVETIPRKEIAAKMADMALAGEVERPEELDAEAETNEAKQGTGEIDEKLDALYNKVRVFLEDSSREDLLQGQQLDALKDALTVITAQLNEASYAAFAGNYMSNHPQIIAQIDTMMRQAEMPLRFNQDVKDQDAMSMFDDMQQMFESITATEPGNVRAIELESFALNFRNDCSLHYEDKKLTITLRNFNQSVHDGYTTVSDVQQLLANVNALVANAAGVSLRKGQRKLQLADQAK